MTDSVGSGSDRMAAFEAEIASLRLKGGDAGSENQLLRAGVAGMGLGVVLAVAGAALMSSTATASAQRAYMVQGAMLGLALLVVGAALFIRYSLGRYLRFWMIRLVHEERANTDRLIEAIERASSR